MATAMVPGAGERRSTTALDVGIDVGHAVRGPIGRQVVQRLVGDRTARVGLVIVAGCVAVALVGPILAPNDPLEVTTERLRRPGATGHLLGTDGLGRDLLSRLLHGARLSLGSATLAAALVSVVGLVVGMMAGYVGGLVDKVLMRLVDVVLAVPGLVLALAVAGLFEPSLLAVMLALVTVWWAGYARIVRGMVLSIREQPFVESARSVGAGEWRVVWRHVLPGVVSTVVVLATLEIGQLLLVISGLSFLGLGSPPPTPEWGAMLNDGRVYFLSDPHVVLVPGIAISLAVLGFNLLGDGIRDVLDPRLAHLPRPGLRRLRRRQPAPPAAIPGQ
ncbi:MAG: ABC transporter permease [Acidimicrobiales bacterium]